MAPTPYKLADREERKKPVHPAAKGEKGELSFADLIEGEANAELTLVEPELGEKELGYVTFKPEASLKLCAGGIEFKNKGASPAELKDQIKAKLKKKAADLIKGTKTIKAGLRSDPGSTSADLLEEVGKEILEDLKRQIGDTTILNEFHWDEFEVESGKREATADLSAGGFQFKIVFSVEHKKTHLKAKGEVVLVSLEHHTWKAVSLEGGFEYECKLKEEIELGEGLTLKGGSLKASIGGAFEPAWGKIALEIIGSEAALVALEAITAVALIYIAAKWGQKIYEDHSAERAMNLLAGQIGPVQEQICQGFAEGVQARLRDHHDPEKSPRGAGFQLGLRAKSDVVAEVYAQKVRIAQAAGGSEKNVETDSNFDDEVVAKTSDPELQRKLLDKLKASGKILSVARCIVFASWDDEFHSQATTVKLQAWDKVFGDPNSNRGGAFAQPNGLLEERVYLKALGRSEYRRFTSHPVPPANKVDDVNF